MGEHPAPALLVRGQPSASSSVTQIIREQHHSTSNPDCPTHRSKALLQFPPFLTLNNGILSLTSNWVQKVRENSRYMYWNSWLRKNKNPAVLCTKFRFSWLWMYETLWKFNCSGEPTFWPDIIKPSKVTFGYMPISNSKGIESNWGIQQQGYISFHYNLERLSHAQARTQSHKHTLTHSVF